ncbi:MAG: glycosyltransferase involved in cell wall biosynthesis [Psychroserpens sp.]|jgi:glycosyltransferase involved in cell wall biosynthesis
MRVLYFHQHFSTPKGRGGIRSYGMAQSLLRQGHNVTLVCGRRNGGQTGLNSEFKKGKREGVVDGIDIIEFDLSYSNSDGLLKRSMTFIRYALKSVSIALFHDYDIVFATTTPLTAGIPGIFARWLRRKYFVFEVRDLWPELPKEMGVITNPIVLAAMSALEWCSYRSAHRCIALSPGIVEGIKRRGVNANKIALVPNGCDLDIFSEASAVERPKEIPKNNFMAIFAGTHGLANGLDSVLNAAFELKQRGRNDITIVLVGDGKLKPTLLKRAQDEGLNNVVFLEPVNKDKIAELLRNADVGLQVLSNIPAFYYGTSPNKFFDYIAAGLPVINNYPGWLADMINDNGCGFAVSPEDAGAFADALESAADNKETLFLMGKNSKNLAIKDFNRHDLADKWGAWVTGVVK